MGFITDKQTLDDLNLLGKYKNSSVYNLFNRTKTAGAERLLESMFKDLLTDDEQINQRSAVFQYFQAKGLEFPFDLDVLHAAENYFNGASSSNILFAAAQAGRRKTLFLLGLRMEHELVAAGLIAAIKLLDAARLFVSDLLQQDPDGSFAPILNNVLQIFTGGRLNWLNEAGKKTAFSFFQTIKYDHLLRTVLRDEMETVMKMVYAVDMYISVALVSKEKGYSYAVALPAAEEILEISGGFHPCIEKAVPNSVLMTRDSNVIFLTGANMAGKSTFMKSYGISIYLAHMGFPVPARKMRFAVKEGMYTSINVPDDLNMGYSHFYAEVLRVKKIAEEVSSPKNLIVIFDELFKGTNVKDAYDATLAVSEVFAEHRNCFFIISTHIVEVGTALAERCNNILFTYMPTEMRGKVPVYTYIAKEGISGDRHGMMIIENERILEIITA